MWSAVDRVEAAQSSDGSSEGRQLRRLTFVLALGLVVVVVAQLVATSPHDARLLPVVTVTDLLLVALFGAHALGSWGKLVAQRAREGPSFMERAPSRALGERSTSSVELSRGFT